MGFTVVSFLLTVACGAAAARAWQRARSDTNPGTSNRPGSDWLAACGRRFRPHQGDRTAELRALLASAGLPDPGAVDRFLGVRLLSILGGLATGLALAAAAPAPVTTRILILAACFTVGFFLPLQLLKSRSFRRRLEIAQAVPLAVDLMVTCMDAGLGLEQALAEVARELRHGEAVLSDELTMTMNEINAGVPLPEATRRLGARARVEELENLCIVIGQATILGARVGATLHDYAETMRRQQTAQLEERAGKMGAQLTLPLALCLVPSGLMIMIGPAVLRVMRVLAGE